MIITIDQKTVEICHNKFNKKDSLFLLIVQNILPMKTTKPSNKELYKSHIFLSIPFAIVLIFGGCCSNVISFETLVNTNYSQFQSLTSFITFFQLSYTIIINIPFIITKFHSRKVPIRKHIVSALLFLGGNWLNNFAFSYSGVTIPCHIIFKSLNVLINLVLGYIILKKKYSASQVSLCVLITIGCILALVFKDNDISIKDYYGYKSSIMNLFYQKQSLIGHSYFSYNSEFIHGICVLLTSSIMASLLQIYNCKIYQEHGKDCWKEVMIAQHLLTMPALLLFNQASIKQNCLLIVKSFATNKTFVLKLVINCITQSVCIYGVNLLASNLDSSNFIVLNITLTFRKLLSLIISCILFNNNMSTTSWIGCFVAFICCFLYSFV